jgi:GT2 family glycosyltransferase
MRAGAKSKAPRPPRSKPRRKSVIAGISGGVLKKTHLALTPERDVENRGGRFVATSPQPWLSIEACAALTPGKLVEIIYRASLWDAPARPVFRFWTQNGGWLDQIGPAPVAGTAIWRGRIPPETLRVSVSPTNCPGRFDFALASIRKISAGALIAKYLRLRPRSAFAALLAGRIGQARQAGVTIDWTTGATPLTHYAAWREARARPIDLEGLDAPRCDWTTGPEIHLLVAADLAGEAERARLITALRAQLYSRWQVLFVGGREGANLPEEPRIRGLRRNAVGAFLRALPANALVAAIAPGDALHPFALAAITEAAARQPETEIFYGDEDYCLSNGKLAAVLKPSWSPTLQANRPYLGRAVFLRAKILADWPENDLAAYVARAEIPRGAPLQTDQAKPLSLGRVLLSRGEPWPRPTLAQTETPAPAVRLAGNPSALILIPTRDRARLLSRCLASIFAKTAFDNFSIIIVDNGNVEPASLRLFEKFRGDRIVSVLHNPEPFNDSSLCNAAAARRKADVLVFLDDNLEVLSEDWLGRLAARALLPDVGAVGGALLGPGGRVRLAGLGLGTDDGLRPRDAFTPARGDDPLGRDLVAHEVSAVPRACLAVARRKFMLVGGFDADHLPTEHNDIDLCLRLSEKGWTAQIDPAVRLARAARSVSSAATLRATRAPAEQRRWLETRWLAVLRDDPFFHPGLSLRGPDDALG